MASEKALLTPDAKKLAIEKLKMAAVLQYTLPGVPCLYYGDENAMEGHIDPFCRQCYNWDVQNTGLISFYQALGKLRSDYKEIFKDGEFQDILVKDGLFYFKRRKNNSEIYVCVNNSSKSYLLETKVPYQNCLDKTIYQNGITIQPYSYQIFKKQIF